MPDLYLDLLRQWCDALLRLQVRHLPGQRGRGLQGGILCPACSRIHGRSADAVYPLLCIARHTGDRAYISAAVELLDWSDHVRAADGSFDNEPTGHAWKGITVFSALAIGEALRHHGDLLDAPTRARWIERLRAACEYLMGTFTINTGNINYPATATATLTVASRVLGNGRYEAKARQLARECLKYFTEPNALVWGEGDLHKPSPSGLRPVDLGYNVEETLPALALYATLTNDLSVMSAVVKSLRSHLAFMLPDGAWDNSWGTRNFKWPYWGSRTSDGCQGAYALLADHDPLFAEAAWRNTQLLAACTHEGILQNGPHGHRTGTPPCIHHTFCHAKALAAAIDAGRHAEQAPHPRLPRESAKNLIEFPEIRTWLASAGPWHATVTAYDFLYTRGGHASGGALSLLWHEKLGPIVTASMTQYAMVEPTNMEPQRMLPFECLTPRIECRNGATTLVSIVDPEATVMAKTNNGSVEAIASGALLPPDYDGSQPSSDRPAYGLRYTLTQTGMEIEAGTLGQNPEFILPIVTPADEPITPIAPDELCIDKPGGSLIIRSHGAPMTLPVALSRSYNPVPGVQALVVRIAMPRPVRISIEVMTK